MDDFKITGQSPDAVFTLTVHRGEGMCLLAMNWKNNERPPDDFVGFMIEYREPNSDRFWTLNNRLSFTDASKISDKSQLSTRVSPIQKFRWVHFPSDASLVGAYSYRVTPVFMSPSGELSYGAAQSVDIALMRETYAGEFDVGFTRGFISSQAFVARYGKTEADVATLIPPKATQGNVGLTFKSTNPKATEAYDWMGFEARWAILAVLDAAIADPTAQVRIVAYDFNIAEIYDRVCQLQGRVKIIIDDSGTHGDANSAESTAVQLLSGQLGAANVKREMCGGLQHNKFIVVDGAVAQKAVCGSTNFSWRAFYVQANNAITVTGKPAITPFVTAFDHYWSAQPDVPAGAKFDLGAFEGAGLGGWTKLPLPSLDAELTFSPHSAKETVLQGIADDIDTVESSLLYSLAFLYETPGPIKTAITKVTGARDKFVYGISDKKVGGLDVTPPDGNPGVVYPQALSANVPPPFSAEPTAGSGARMHHKFVVIDFDKPSARVYVGSFNFSGAADRRNGENLMLIKDRRVTTAFAVEALSLFDHYHFRVVSGQHHDNDTPLVLAKPPGAGQKPWFDDDYTVSYKIRDRQIFADPS